MYCEGYTDYSGQVKEYGMDLLIARAGGRNVLTQEMGATSPKVSPEWLIAENPDVLIKVLSVKSMENAADQYAAFTGRTGFANLDAVFENRTYMIRNDIAYGPRTFAGAVAKMLHPEVVASLSARAALDDSTTSGSPPPSPALPSPTTPPAKHS
ncbi:MAG: hypothetical protein MJ014_01070 [Methanocorpusculum sp.]|nr:hypothetical protein [Methanocorpusculum sp.]